jgi:hypothetical protein
MAPSTTPTGPQTTQLGRSHAASGIPNAYAPWVPSPLNPNPKEQHMSPRASRRIIRRVAKPSSASQQQPLSPQQQQQQQAQLRKQMRSISTTERLLRRKFEEALRVHHLIEQRNGAPISPAKLHRAAAQAQRSQRTAAGAKTTSSHASMRHYSIEDPEKQREYSSANNDFDEWSLDSPYTSGMAEDDAGLDLDLLERKLGYGWQEEAAGLRQLQDDSSRHQRVHKLKLLGGALRRPTKGMLLAVALVCLCGLPALRGQASVLRRIGSLAMGL